MASTRNRPPAPPPPPKPGELLADIEDGYKALERAVAGYNKWVSGWNWLQARKAGTKAQQGDNPPPLCTHKASADGNKMVELTIDMAKLRPETLEKLIPEVIFQHAEALAEAAATVEAAAARLKAMAADVLRPSGRPPAPPPVVSGDPVDTTDEDDEEDDTP